MTEVLLRYCENCNAEGASKRCSRCEAAWYCSKECQKQAWKRGHRAKCSVQAAAPPTAAPAGAAAATPAAAAAPTATAAAEAAPAVDPATVAGMSLREMKQLLVARGVDFSKCIEKGDFRALAKEALASDDGEEEGCAICLGALQHPQTLPCGHRFCRGCVASMRQHGAGEAQVCPLCRGEMPEVDALLNEASCLTTRFCVRAAGTLRDAQLPVAIRALPARAAKLCREALAIDPSLATAHVNLSTALYQSGDTAGGVRAARKAIDIDPKCSVAHFNLGSYLEQSDDDRAAIAAFRAAARLDPHAAVHAMALERLGLLLAGLGEDEALKQSERATHVREAAAALRQAIAADPNRVEARVGLGVLLKVQHEDDSAAERCFRAVIAADPQYADAHVELGLLLRYRRKDSAGAETAYRKAIATRTQNAHHAADAHYHLGVLLHADRADFHQAEACYRAAIARNPGHLSAAWSLGSILLKRNDIDGAEAAWRRCRGKTSADALKARENLAAIQWQVRGDLDGAERELAAILAADPQKHGAAAQLQNIRQLRTSSSSSR